MLFFLLLFGFPFFLLLLLALLGVLVFRRRYRFAATVVVLTAIGGVLIFRSFALPETAEIIAQFDSNREDFATLRGMIEDDIGARECLSVGLDHIGDYWDVGGDWRHRGGMEVELSFAGVLQSVGISEERFGEYRALFDATGSEWVTQCRGYAGEILVFRTGLAVSGCIATINWDKKIPGSERMASYSIEVTPMVDDWFVRYSCT